MSVEFVSVKWAYKPDCLEWTSSTVAVTAGLAGADEQAPPKETVTMTGTIRSMNFCTSEP
jgi:hypothetical protein